MLQTIFTLSPILNFSEPFGVNKAKFMLCSKMLNFLVSKIVLSLFNSALIKILLKPLSDGTFHEYFKFLIFSSILFHLIPFDRE